MLVAPLARLGLALGLLAPLALAVPGSTFTGVTCGDDLGETCPRKPFPESSFTVVACTDNGKLEDYPEYSFYGVRNSVAECAQLAVSKAIMFAVYNAAEGAPPSYTCWGADNHIGTSRVQCEPNVRFRIRVFFHPPAAQASGLSRRRLAKPDAVPTLCPSGLTACKILNSADGYECIDTLSELESCGGCRYGVQAAPVSLRANRRLRSFANIDGTSSHQPVAPIVEEASVGVDCSERRHFGPGLTCTEGACVPYV